MKLFRSLAPIFLATATCPAQVWGNFPIDNGVPERDEFDNELQLAEQSFDCTIGADGVFGSTEGNSVEDASFLFRMTYSDDPVYELDDLLSAINRNLGEIIVALVYPDCERRRLFDLYDGMRIHPMELLTVSYTMAGMDTSPNYKLEEDEEEMCNGVDVDTDSVSCSIFSVGWKIYLTDADGRNPIAATNDTVISIILSIIKDSLDDAFLAVEGIDDLEWIRVIEGEPNEEPDNEDEDNAKEIEDEILQKDSDNNGEDDVGSKLNNSDPRNGNEGVYILGGSMLALTTVALSAFLFKKRWRDRRSLAARRGASVGDGNSEKGNHILLNAGTEGDGVEILYGSGSPFRSDEY